MKGIREWFSGLFDKGPKPSKYTGKVWVGTSSFRVCDAAKGFIPSPVLNPVGFVDHTRGYWIRLYEDGTTSDHSKWEPYEEPSSSGADSAA